MSHPATAVDLSLVQRIVPELMEVLRERVRILQRLQLLQPIGRRALAAELGTTERVLRAEVDALRAQGLVVVGGGGMTLTGEAMQMLPSLELALASFDGRSELATRLSRSLNIANVVVVAGDSDEDEWVKDVIGHEAAQAVRRCLRAGDVLAVTGGTTMAALARRMPRLAAPLAVKVVPARGGLGENVSLQANTIAAELAGRLGGESIMLHVPDRLSQETFAHLVEEPQIQERLREVQSATVVAHGIGDAVTMAVRRQMSAAELALLAERGAVAEAFGYYFDADGRIVYTMTTVGLRLSDLDQMRTIIAVAGGTSKAAAIAAAAKAYRIDTLITDEGAAKRIVENSHGGMEDDH
ncbi:sugar-binding transcriptional regulator [Alicyclobacillus shizuokensis]|uniref:sugar-binding transcriptional regulator n=1 Tax=Alicyclobacillus shizuokensis TaxID=392014 RepID=UPI00082A5C5E|nr:sugar-binding domain-containing protein [Alicyclobacillus shizuokensis]